MQFELGRPVAVTPDCALVAYIDKGDAEILRLRLILDGEPAQERTGALFSWIEFDAGVVVQHSTIRRDDRSRPIEVGLKVFQQIGAP